MLRLCFAITPSNAAVESAFSKLRSILTDHRMLLDVKLVEQLLILALNQATACLSISICMHMIPYLGIRIILTLCFKDLNHNKEGQGFGSAGGILAPRGTTE